MMLPCGVYQHYKGNYYLVIGLARNDETNTTMVVYSRLYAREGLPLTVRTLENFLELVGDVPRFRYMGQTQPAPEES